MSLVLSGISRFGIHMGQPRSQAGLPVRPVLDQIDIPSIGKQIEGDLFPSVNPLVGRHEPGPTTGDIWAKYEVKPFLVITREQVLAVGKDPDSLSKCPNELSGFAEEAYMAGLDIFYSVPAPLLQHYPAGGF